MKGDFHMLQIDIKSKKRIFSKIQEFGRLIFSKAYSIPCTLGVMVSAVNLLKKEKKEFCFIKVASLKILNILIKN